LTIHVHSGDYPIPKNTTDMAFGVSTSETSTVGRDRALEDLYRENKSAGKNETEFDDVQWSKYQATWKHMMKNIASPKVDKKSMVALKLPYLSPGGSATDFAAYSYKLYFEDVRLTKHLGVDMYAFSIAWPRLMTTEGRPNPAGVLYYHNLIESLLAAGVTPLVTLYHWDLPLSLASEEDSVGMGHYRLQRPVYPIGIGPGRGEDLARDDPGEKKLPRGASVVEMVLNEERAANDYAIAHPQMINTKYLRHHNITGGTHQHFGPEDGDSEDISLAHGNNARSTSPPDPHLARKSPFHGWLSAAIVRPFVRYADIAFRLYGRRVRHWVTFHDPIQQCIKGYGTGTHAPARCSDHTRCLNGDSAVEPYQCMHNMLLAHAYTAELFNKYHRDSPLQLPPAKLGMTIHAPVFLPRSVDAVDYLMKVERVEDVTADSERAIIVNNEADLSRTGAKKISRKRSVKKPTAVIAGGHHTKPQLAVTISGGDAAPGSPEDTIAAERAMLFQAGWALDPLLYGEYPRVMQQLLGTRLPEITPTQRVLMLRNPPDFFCVGANGAWYTNAANSR